jgi:serine protease AprX
LSSSTSVSTDALNKLDPLAQQQLPNLFGRSRVIVRAIDGTSPALLIPIVEAAGGTILKTLSIVNAQVVDLPNAALLTVADSPLVARISLDRHIVGAMERTASSIGATAVRHALGYDGAGVGVAIIDSGITAWHDDLTRNGASQRVHQFVDVVNRRETPYDDYGHGTHVAGIVAGNGLDSDGARSGIAPAAHLIVLKVLDGSGRGQISDVIAALDYVVTNKEAHNIRVANLSIAAGVFESYYTDPLTLAANRVVEAGVVVVAAAGNYGRRQTGTDAYGGVTAPGNAPWVLTVGASSHSGTVDRADDTMAPFSSRGPTAVDYSAKPDVVAPGVGIESLSDPASAFYTTKSAYLLSGTAQTSYLPYLSLSGTSMGAPVVSGTVALMLQANPALTPNQVKAIVQYTAQIYPKFDPLTEGAGFLNAHGAVNLARSFTDPSNVLVAAAGWGKRLLWGNRMVSGGRLTAGANAWSTDVAWGADTTPAGLPVEWGVICTSTDCNADGATSEPWSDASGRARNVVWGSTCGGANCEGPWTVQGANDDDSVVWGTTDDDSVVWGTTDDDSVVWGTSCSDPSCEPTVWPNP